MIDSHMYVMYIIYMIVKYLNYCLEIKNIIGKNRNKIFELKLQHKKWDVRSMLNTYMYNINIHEIKLLKLAVVKMSILRSILRILLRYYVNLIFDRNVLLI